VAGDNGFGHVDELSTVGLGVGSEHLEGSGLVDHVTRHQDALRLLDRGPAAEGALKVLVLGEAAECDRERTRQAFGVAVDDIGEDATLRCLHDVGGVIRV
jgi:hypothetical protein